MKYEGGKINTLNGGIAIELQKRKKGGNESTQICQLLR